MFDPNFRARNPNGEPAESPRPRLSLLSWTMLSATVVATGAAALIWFG